MGCWVEMDQPLAMRLEPGPVGALAKGGCGVLPALGSSWPSSSLWNGGFVCLAPFAPHSSPQSGCQPYPHFTDDETELRDVSSKLESGSATDCL